MRHESIRTAAGPSSDGAFDLLVASHESSGTSNGTADNPAGLPIAGAGEIITDDQTHNIGWDDATPAEGGSATPSDWLPADGSISAKDIAVLLADPGSDTFGNFIDGTVASSETGSGQPPDGILDSDIQNISLDIAPLLGSGGMDPAGPAANPGSMPVLSLYGDSTGSVSSSFGEPSNPASAPGLLPQQFEEAVGYQALQTSFAPALSGNAVAAAPPAFVTVSLTSGDLAFLDNSWGSANAGPITDTSISSSGATGAQVQQALDESGLSVNGSGIRVGVLSDSFNNLGGAAADEADGALPPAADIDVIKDYASGGTDEGRAMMQIIHDIAPGADLAFYTAFDSEQDFANGILALAAAGCKVIVDDVSYFDEPFFQNGVVAQAIQTVEAEGVTYVTAAGNDANNGYQAAWKSTSGSFKLGSHNISLTDAENFSTTSTANPFQTVTINTEGTGYDVPLLLEWNQAYGTVSSKTADLELLVYNSSGRLLGTATDSADGELTNPWVEIAFASSGTYYIAIENLDPSSNPGLIKEITEGDGLPATISGSNVGTVYGHAMTPGAITTGAVSVADTPAFGVKPAVSETFSSSGAGTELLFANNGTALSSPDQLSPVAVSGVDDIHTTVSDLSDFYGTSAAAASLAGAAALILSADPNLSPAAVEQLLEETALPVANAAVSGAGLVQLDPAVADALASTGAIKVAGTSVEAVQGGAVNDLLTGPATITDSASDLASATVKIANGSAAAVAGDELAINGVQNGSVGDGVTASWNATTDTLTLTGNATIADYETLVGEVTYQDTGTDTTTAGHPVRTVTWTVNDGTNSYNTTSQVTVDRPPVASNSVASDAEGSTVTATAAAGVLSNASDPDGDSLTVIGVSDATNGTGSVGAALADVYGSLTLYGNGSYSYVASNTSAINSAATGHHPVDTFTYTISDGNGGMTTATLAITIDRPPIVQVANLTLSIGQSVAASSLFTASDPDGNTIITYGFMDTGPGDFVLNGVTTEPHNQEIDVTAAQLSELTYVGAAGTPDTVEVRVYDGTLWSSWQSFSAGVAGIYVIGTSVEAVQGGAAIDLLTGAATISDSAVSDLASATVKIANGSAAAVAGDELAINGVQNGSVGDGVTASWNATTDTLTLTGNATIADYETLLGEVTYQDTGTDTTTAGHPVRTVTWTVNDGTNSYNTTSQVTVDRPPVASNSVASDAEGSTVTATAATGVLSNASDPDGDSLTVIGVSDATNGAGSVGAALADVYGSLTLYGNGSYSYVANNTSAINSAATGHHPVDTFTYTISDGHGGMTTATLAITIDRPPIVHVSNVALSAGQSVAASSLFTASDPDGNTIVTYGFMDTGPGEFVLNGVTTEPHNQEIDVTAAQLSELTYVGAAGTPDTVEVRVNDGTLLSSWQSFSAGVAGIYVIGTGVEAVQGGAAIDLLTGPATITDSASDLASATVKIANGSAAAVAGDELAINGVQNGSVGDGVTASWNATTDTLTLTGNATIADYETLLGEVTYQDTGTDTTTAGHPVRTVTWTVNDGTNSYNTTSQVTVDRPPVASNSVASDAEGSTVTATAATGVLSNASDPDGDSLTVIGVSDATNGAGSVGAALADVYGSLTLYGNGSYSYVASNTSAINSAATGHHPVETFTYTISDGNGGTTTATLAITIDRPPIVQVSNLTLKAGQSVAASSLFTASDPDGNTIITYGFMDTGPGEFVLNGVTTEPHNQEIDVTAAQLSELTYVGAPGTPDTVEVRVYDGTLWSSWQSFTVKAPVSQVASLAGDQQNSPFTPSSGGVGATSAADPPGGADFTYGENAFHHWHSRAEGSFDAQWQDRGSETALTHQEFRAIAYNDTFLFKPQFGSDVAHATGSRTEFGAFSSNHTEQHAPVNEMLALWHELYPASAMHDAFIFTNYDHLSGIHAEMHAHAFHLH